MTPLLFAYLGVALMVGLGGIASSLGTGIVGSAAIGAIRKNSAVFGNGMILTALPGTQGLYGFVCYFIVRGLLTPEITAIQGIAIFAAGIIVGFVGVFSSVKQANICANGITAIGNGSNVFGNTLILAAYPELYAILTVATTFLINQAIS